MPLPSASAPALKKTEVVRVGAYFLGRKDGALELHDMHILDFTQAHEAHPDDWALVEAIESLPRLKAYKMPPGPEPKIIDKRDVFKWPTPEQLKTEPPPMVEMTPMHEKRSPGGGLLFPRIG